MTDPGPLDPVRLLGETDLFSALEPPARERIFRLGTQRRYAAGETVFRAGEPAEALWLVLGGRVKVFHVSPAGDEQILHLLDPGSLAAEAAMFSGRDYPAGCEALEDSRLLALRRETIRAAVEESPEVAMAMLAGLSAKLREFAGLIEQLSLRDVPGRLAGALLAISERSGSMDFRLPHAKRDLAASLGTTPETLSRALGRLSRAGWLRVQGAQVRILDADALRRLAENG